MAKQDLRINEYGIDVRDLRPGQQVLIYRKDSPRETRETWETCLLLEVEYRAPSYKGTRNLTVFMKTKAGWEISRHVDSGQVCGVLGELDKLDNY